MQTFTGAVFDLEELTVSTIKIIIVALVVILSILFFGRFLF
jgi:hypothetical protein